jgi:hypothetical protein
MSTIPAKKYVNVIPGVLNAGGSALDLIAVVLTTSTRVPIGTFQSFPSAAAGGQYFGLSSHQYSWLSVYFNGYTNATKIPGSVLYVQYPAAAVAAYLRGANVQGLGLAYIQGLSGSLTVVMDGYTHTAGSLNLSGATSFSAAAALIQAGLTASEPTEASVTGSIAAATASVTAAINGDVMTVTNVSSGTLAVGAICIGAGVTPGTQITEQLTGTTGGVGTYGVSITQVVASTTVTATYGLLTVTAVGSGTLSVGQALTGSGVTAGTQITALGTGQGLTGTYYATPSQTTSSTTITATPVALTVTFDSVSGAFVITSGITGPASTSAFATGTLSAVLLMTSATGAVLSQGAAQATPSAFMTGVAALTQNWATFTTDFDPDFGSGNAQKLAFAAWANNQEDDYMYVAWDTDITPTESTSATNSLGNLLIQNNYSGTMPVWEPAGADLYHAAFICGMVAAINFTALNGRITLAYKSQTGLVASVTSITVADNLEANGYNYVGAVATANETFVYLYPGTVSGPFEWADSYVNQIWLNNALQLAILNLLTQINSIPYNAPGYALLEAACADPINAGLNFGAFRAGVTLSAAQIAEVNSQAGINIATTLAAQGWYLQVQNASPQVRQARGSPPCYFWYTDGQSIQVINLNSINVQ